MTRLYSAAIKGRHEVAGRRVRPTALGLAIFTAAFGGAIIRGRDLLDSDFSSFTVGTLCAFSALAFTVGFITNRPLFARVGYLLTFFVLTTNTVLEFIEFGSTWWLKMLTFAPKTPSIWMGLGVAVIAGGAYWLEGFRE